MQRERRLDFEAAEKAYRTFRAEADRVLNAGGAASATAVMKSTAGGPYLSEFTTAVVAFKDTGSRQVGGASIDYVHTGAYSSTELNLETCENGSKVKTYIGKKSLGHDKIFVFELAVRKTSSGWKVWSASSKREARSCDD